MVRILKLTGTGCCSVRRNTLPRYLMSVSRRFHPSYNAPFLAAQGLRGPRTSWGTILTANTGGTVSGSWSITPTCFPNLRGMGFWYHLGAWGTGIMSPKIPARGGTPYQTDDTKTLLWGHPVFDKAWTQSLWSWSRIFCTWTAQLHTTIATGRPCTRVFRRRGNGGQWWGSWCWRRGQQCERRVWFISQSFSRCWYMGVVVGWWRGPCSKCYIYSIIG